MEVMQTKVIDLDTAKKMLGLLMQGDEIYEDFTVTDEVHDPGMMRRYRRLIVACDHSYTVKISEDGGVTWNGPVDWDVIEIIRHCTRTLS